MYFRRDRYTVTSELLEVSHKILSISQKIGDKQRLCDAHFELGFTNLWYGDLVQAEEHLQKSLTLSEQCSNLYSQTLCYTYLTIIYRKQRNFQRTQEYVNHSIRTATNRNLVTYLATARANMAWLALHSGNNDQAEALGKEALELWGQVPFVYPFQWTALWPLIAVMLEKEDYDQAVKYAQGLLASDQQRLPDDITAQILVAIEHGDEDQNKNLDKYLKESLRLAGEYKFL
jgi:tetratricopeptide (TPR) repeat protein